MCHSNVDKEYVCSLLSPQNMCVMHAIGNVARSEYSVPQVQKVQNPSWPVPIQVSPETKAHSLPQINNGSC